MRIKVLRTFFQDNNLYQAGNTYEVEGVSASPRYYQVLSRGPVKTAEPAAKRSHHRVKVDNAAITNQDKGK